MKDAECQNGVQVVAQSGNTYNSRITGKCGAIALVERDANGNVYSFCVIDDNGNPIGYSRWCSLESWALYQPPANRAKFAANQAKAALSKECPCGITREDCDYHNLSTFP